MHFGLILPGKLVSWLLASEVEQVYKESGKD